MKKLLLLLLFPLTVFANEDNIIIIDYTGPTDTLKGFMLERKFETCLLPGGPWIEIARVGNVTSYTDPNVGPEGVVSCYRAYTINTQDTLSAASNMVEKTTPFVQLPPLPAPVIQVQ